MSWLHCSIKVGDDLSILISDQAMELTISKYGGLNPSSVFRLSVQEARADNNHVFIWQPVAALNPLTHKSPRNPINSAQCADEYSEEADTGECAAIDCAA